MTPRRAARIDKNQTAIVSALRAVGATVATTHAVGAGFPDLVVGYRGVTYLLEVKSPRGRLTRDQVTWHGEWRGHVAVVRGEAQALAAIGATVDIQGGT